MEYSVKQNIWKLLFLEFTMLTPIPIMTISLLDYGQLVLTIFLYNFITMAVLPAIYLNFLEKDPKKQKISYYFRNRLENPKKQILIGLLLFAIVYCLIVINYQICYKYFKKEVIDQISIDTKRELMSLIILIFLLGITNPFLEGWFWRNFIPQAIFDSFNHDYNNEKENIDANQNGQIENIDNNADDENININNNNNQLEERLNDQNDNDKKLKKRVNEELFQLIITFHYAIYHFFVVIFITTTIYAVVALFGIWILGRIFLFLNNNVGYITNGLFHMGIDVGVCTLAVIILYYNKIL